MPPPFQRRIQAQLDALSRQGLERRVPALLDRDGPTYTLGARRVVGMCSNDYLGLAGARTPAASLLDPSPGASASRLVAGDLPVHRHVEARLAELLDTEDAILFPSGFQANLGCLPALIHPEDQVHSDRLNHASLIDGLRLARARPTVLEHLGAPPPPCAEVSWWVCESVYSMDGDETSPEALHQHQSRGGAIYLDEAHAIGLRPQGKGLAGQHHLLPDVVVAPLGKAFGTQGAAVGTSRVVAHWLRTRARSFVFSTGVSPLLAATIDEAITRVTGPEGDHARTRLDRNIATLHRSLGVSAPRTPILPVLVGANHDAVSLSAALLDLGWHVQPIRPPTVPDHTARLRITVTAMHSADQIEAFAHDLRHVLEQRELPLRLATTHCPVEDPTTAQPRPR